MISFTAKGQGYYRVLVDNVEISKHVTEREALESAVNHVNNGLDVRVIHDYEVQVKDPSRRDFLGVALTCSTYPMLLSACGSEDDAMSTITFVNPGIPTPDPFTLIDQINVGVGSQIESNSITVTGLYSATVTVPISVDIGQYEINNNGIWHTEPGTVKLNDTVIVRHQSSPSNSTSIPQTLTIGTQQDTFTSTTISAATGNTAIFFTSLLSAPPNSYVTIFGYNFSNPATVRVGGKIQTVINQAYDDPYLTMHPALIKLGHDYNAYDLTWNPSAQVPYQRIDILLDNVVSGDTGLQIDGVALVTDETGSILNSLIRESDTVTSFKVHTGNTWFVDEDAISNGSGTEANPFNTLVSANAAISNGDVVYIKETINPMNLSNFNVNGDQVAWSWASAESGTASQPNALCAYPNHYPKWDRTTGAGIIGMNGGGAQVSYMTIFGLEVIDATGTGSGQMAQTSNACGQNECRHVACRCVGFGNFSGGTWSNFAGGPGSNNSRVLGCSSDLTGKAQPEQGMCHVWYAVGNGVLNGCFFLHCRNERHNVGRVIQAYGHNLGEELHNFHVSFCNIEGAKDQVSQQQPVGGIMISHTDGVAGQNGGSWVKDAHMEYNTVSGCSTGIRIWGTNAVPGVGEGGVLAPDVIVTNNVGYDCSTQDIWADEYYRIIVSNNIYETALQFDFAIDGTFTTSINNTNGPPTSA